MSQKIKMQYAEGSGKDLYELNVDITEAVDNIRNIACHLHAERLSRSEAANRLWKVADELGTCIPEKTVCPFDYFTLRDGRKPRLIIDGTPFYGW